MGNVENVGNVGGRRWLSLGGPGRRQTEAKRQVNVSEAISEPKLIEMIEAKWRDIE